MKVVAIIPIKLNNERLPNKNTKLFSNGKPLCSYIFDTLLKVEKIDEIYIYCSNPKIKEYLPEGITFLRRNQHLDSDTTSMNQVLKEFLDEVDADIYVLSHATSPFIKADTISSALEKVISSGYDSALAVSKLQEFLWRDNKPSNYNLEKIPRTQDLPEMYYETSGFYIFRKIVLQEFGRRIGFKPFLQEVSKIEAIDIDELEDFMIANAVSALLKEKEGK